MTLHTLVIFLTFVLNAISVELTHFGYEKPGESGFDTNSSKGIGAFGFDDTEGSLQAIAATGVTPVALSPDVAATYGLQPGQQFTAQAGGQTYNLVYADKTADYLTGRIDLYDQSGSFQGSGAQVTSINGGAIIEGGTIGGGVNGGVNGTIETVNIAVVDAFLNKFKTAGQTWVAPLTKGATTIFWLLALISLVWTGVIMVLKRAEIGEIMLELVRFIMTIGIFFWLLTNGPTFAGDIINSLRQLGGQASGTGQSVFPGDLITLGATVLQGQLKPINLLMPFNAIVPSILAIIVLVVCILICANVVLLLVSGWIVLYAGVIVLGFGSSRFTSDIAINYFRTALSVGLSLMTMQLIISLGISFLQNLVSQANTGDIGQLIAVTVGVILWGAISHKLPQMVSGMVTGSGQHGGIGAMGIMSAVGAAMAASSIARSMAGAAGPIGAAGAAGMSAAQQMIERISAAAGIGGNGNGSSTPPPAPVRMNAMAPSISPPSRGAPSSPPPVTSAAAVPQGSGSAQHVSQAVVADDPPESRPTAPDEQRGIEEQPDFGVPQDDIEQA